MSSRRQTSRTPPRRRWAHTRQRGEFLDIIDQALREQQRPDVLLGGGRATFLPQSEEGSIRDDDRDVIEEFREQGYAYAGTEAELRQALADDPTQLLGLFTLGTMNVYLDREHDPDPEVLGDFTDQPTLMNMTRAALDVLGRHDEGFFLMVEAASIDKMEHPLDGPRAVYDAIEFDQSIGLAKQWASTRSENTLIVVTADHNHSMSIVGTHDAREDLDPDCQSNGVYADAGYPTYVDSDGDGFPDTPDADVQLFFGWSNHPDHRDDFEHNETFLQPALLNEDGIAVPKPGPRPGCTRPDRQPALEPDQLRPHRRGRARVRLGSGGRRLQRRPGQHRGLPPDDRRPRSGGRGGARRG